MKGNVEVPFQTIVTLTAKESRVDHDNDMEINMLDESPAEKDSLVQACLKNIGSLFSKLFNLF